MHFAKFCPWKKIFAKKRANNEPADNTSLNMILTVCIQMLGRSKRQVGGLKGTILKFKMLDEDDSYNLDPIEISK